MSKTGSDLIGNALRSWFAEFLLVLDLGIANGARTDWAARDLAMANAARVEFKTLAIAQSRSQGVFQTPVLNSPGSRMRPQGGWSSIPSE